MVWAPGLSSLVAFTAAGILGTLAVIGSRRPEDEARAFVLLMVSVSLWAAVYGIQLGFTTATEQLPWQRATLAVSGTVPVLLLRFAQQYAGSQWRRGSEVQALLVGEAVLFAGLAITNPAHQLVWSQATLRSTAMSPVLQVEFAVGYYSHIVVGYGVVTVALWTILSVYFRSPTLYRRQAALLLGGAFPAFATHVLYTTGTGPVPGLDLTPFAFTVTGITYGLALFHFDLLERTPVAQRQVTELTGDGLLVVDTDGIVVHANQVAKQLFDVDDVGDTHVEIITSGDDLTTSPGGGDRTSSGDDLRGLDETTMTGAVDGTRRVYDVHVSDLTGESELHAGTSILLRDVTDRESYQRRLEVTQRVLRHNLRNDTIVIMGQAEVLADSASTDERREHAETIRKKGEELVALSDKARELVELPLAPSRETDVVALDVVLSPLLVRFRERYPAATLAVDRPDGACSIAAEERIVSVGLWELLENAAEHNDTGSLTVEISVREDGDHVRVEISDDGSGLPETARQVLGGQSETPLQHGRGLGLWLAYWCVTTSGGEIAVGSADRAGTAVVVSLPSPDSRHTSSVRA